MNFLALVVFLRKLTYEIATSLEVNLPSLPTYAVDADIVKLMTYFSFHIQFALQIYGRLEPENEAENKAWLRRAIQAAIKEYHNVWVSEPRLDPKTGLSRYRPDGMGVPSETEASHFTHILKPYADKHGIAVNELVQKYNDGEVHEPELDIYFLHDRAVRESGHDSQYRPQLCILC